MRARPERISTSPAASFAVKRRRDPRFDFAWHFHPEVELTWIVRSRGRRFVGDSIEEYRDGDLVLIGPNLPHTWHSDKPARRFYPPGEDKSGGRMHPAHEAVCAQFAPDFLGDLPELRGVRALIDRASRGLVFGGRTLKAVARTLDGLVDVEGLPRLRALLEILERLAAARDARPLSSRPFSEPRRTDMERIDRVCRWLAERYAEDVSLPEAAGVAHLSVPAFCRFFKSRTGKTLVGYLTELRIGRACRLLMETDRSVSDVGFACGFNNLSNFNRRFRALKGLSPREFRAPFRPIPD